MKARERSRLKSGKGDLEPEALETGAGAVGDGGGGGGGRESSGLGAGFFRGGFFAFNSWFRSVSKTVPKM